MGITQTAHAEFSLNLAVTVLKIITIFLHSFLSYHEFAIFATLENQFRLWVGQPV
ncbi:hypothetical protein PCC7418_0459 [Halothece sp. PCC 7418]|nr:hypothetical protein PCC7418_0459 [Halothece sp. PCC 7418]